MFYYTISLEDCRKCKRYLREEPEYVVCLRRMRPRKEQQKKAKVNAYQCSICGVAVLLPWRHLKDHEEKEKEEMISANLKILKDSQSSSLRKKLAIYRLYKYANLSSEEIARLTDQDETYVREIISDMFVALCLPDKKCVFRKILKETENLAHFPRAKNDKNRN